MNDMKDFFLAGHSFGGYICGHYAKTYHHNIKKLLMLSPAGVVIKPENFSYKKAKIKGKQKFVFKIAKRAWKNKWSPFGIMRKSGSLIGKQLIKFYMNRRMRSSLSGDEEFDHLLNYLHQIFMREGSTEYAIYICFELGMWAKNPLEKDTVLGNPEIQIPISFFYGDQDWMDHLGG